MNNTSIQLKELINNYMDHLLDQCRGAGVYTVRENLTHIKKLIELTRRLDPYEAERVKWYQEEAERLLDKELDDAEEAMVRFHRKREGEKQREECRIDSLAMARQQDDEEWCDYEGPL